MYTLTTPVEIPKEMCKPIATEIVDIMKDKLYQRTGMNPDIKMVILPFYFHQD